MTHSPLSTVTALLLLVGAAPQAIGTTITLNALTESVMVGLNDTVSSTAPTAPGANPNWYTSDHAGTVRARVNGNNVALRTQWNFRFDISALAGVDSADITSATLSIPQIGRLNTQPGPGNHLHLYANTYDWSDDGSTDYPTWNRGRPGQGDDGFTVAANFGGSETHGTAQDLNNTNVEGTFIIDSSTSIGLLTAVQTWAADPTDNEGFLMTYQNAHLVGLSFGTPTLEITVVPEPATSGLLLLGVAMIIRRRRP